MTLVAPNKPAAGHSVRTGRHQRRQKKFAKTYWPYIPMLLVVIIALAASHLLAPRPTSAVLGASSDFSTATLLATTNQQRYMAHESPLSVNTMLTRAAQSKANDMVRQNYWSHESPDGGTPWSFIAATGYTYQLAGENLAYGFTSAKQAIAAWMNSTEHRRNLLNRDFTDVGFGVSSSSNFQNHGPAVVLVAMYAEPRTTPVDQSLSAVQTLHSKPVARVEVLGSTEGIWPLLLLAVVCGGAAMIVVLRHARYWHRAAVYGEEFIIHHPLLDIIIVAIAASAFIFGQTVGFIQ